MKTYEIIFILDDKKFEDAGEAFSREVAAHIKSLGGQVKERTSLGRKQFTRPIKKRTAGVYWDFIVELDPDKVLIFEDKYRLNLSILRLKSFQYEKPPAAAVGTRMDDGDGRSGRF